MALIYTQSKKTMESIEKRLGPPSAKYYNSFDGGAFVGASWLTNRTLAKKLQKRHGKEKIEVL